MAGNSQSSTTFPWKTAAQAIADGNESVPIYSLFDFSGACWYQTPPILIIIIIITIILILIIIIIIIPSFSVFASDENAACCTRANMLQIQK
jgi:hypothetical protein